MNHDPTNQTSTVDQVPPATPPDEDRACDTLEGMRFLLSHGLPGLHELVLRRHDLARRHRIQAESGNPTGFHRRLLHEWVVLGVYVLDEFGQVSQIMSPIPEPLRRRALAELVMPWKADGTNRPVGLDQLLPRDTVVCLSMSVSIPKATDRCARCEEGWSFENITDVVDRDRDLEASARWLHRECNGYRVYEEERTRILKACTEAGLIVQSISATPNRYWPKGAEPHFAAPWFFVEVHHLGKLLIGSRKRVDVIDWSRSKTIGAQPDLFKDEGVTQEPTMVHAWTDEKLVQYLARLKVAAGLR